jgi:predicted Zn-dependent protease
MSSLKSLYQVVLPCDVENANSLTGPDSQDAHSDIASISVKVAEMTIESVDDIDEMRAAIEREPQSFWRWYGLCKLHLLKGDLDGAVTACEAGLERTPRNPAPMTQLQNLYAVKGEYLKAIEISKELFATEPSILAESFRNVPFVSMFTSPQELEMKLFLERCALTTFSN